MNKYNFFLNVLRIEKKLLFENVINFFNLFLLFKKDDWCCFFMIKNISLNFWCDYVVYLYMGIVDMIRVLL